jgi:uncharacterized protein YggE
MRRSTRAGLVAAGLAAAAAVLAGCAAPTPTATGPAPAGITARGVGEVTGTPDKMTIDLAVATRSPNAQTSLNDNAARSAALRDQLKGKGVADADVRTSRFGIDPTFDNNGRISGYEVSNQLTVTVRDIAAAGGIIDAAAQAAGDAVRVQSLSFAIDDDSKLLADARASAVKKAQEQAKQLADAAGVALGSIRTITETSSGNRPPPVPYAASAAADSAKASQVSPGTQQLSVSVEIVYNIG